ncbi:MAG: hypothetical protein ACREXT_05745 [Gammaproteobacteria bacterium]
MRIFHKVLASMVITACSSPLAVRAQEHAMIGCLEAAGESFVLSHAEGGGTVAIAESTVDLSGHVGHKVEITGTAVTGEDPASHTMKVTAMKHIDVACP